MAYISAEEVKVIRDNLKKEFPYVKFSVRREHSTTVAVNILEAPFEFYSHSAYSSGNIQVNHYYLGVDQERYQEGRTNDEGYPVSYGPHETWVFLRRVHAIVSATHWDDSDLMTDYHNSAFYYSIQVGKGDQPYVRTERPADLAPLEDAPVVDEEPSAGSADADRIIQEAFLEPAPVSQVADQEGTLTLTDKGREAFGIPVSQVAENAAEAASETLASDASAFLGKVFYDYPADCEVLQSPVYLYRPTEFGFSPNSARLAVAHTTADINELVAQGLRVVSDDIAEQFARVRGYDIPTYFLRLARGEY